MSLTTSKKKTMPKTIKPGTRESRSFTLDRAAIDNENRTVELAFSSETPVERWWGREILDHSPQSIRMNRLTAGAPLLSDHSNSIRAQIGVVESVSIGSDRVGRAVVRFGKSAADDEIFQKVQDGIIRNVSVGYIVHKSQLTETDGELETFRITDWEPLEVSLVAVPADSAVGVGRSLESPIIEIQEERSMPKENNPSAEETQRATTEQINRGVAAERKRVADILTIGEDHNEVGGRELATKAIAEERTVQDFQTEILEARRSHKPQTETPGFGQGVNVTENADQDGTRGFKTMGHFCRFVRAEKIGVRLPEHNEIRAASNYASIASGDDGAILIPPTFQQTIDRIAFEEASLLNMIGPTPIEGNSMTYPRSDATPWGSTGVQAYWEGEADTHTPTKPNYKKSQLNLHKLTAMVNVTDEMLEDSSAMSVEIPREMGIAIDWKVQDSIVNGNGAGMPLGMLNASATVSQAKESGQAAATVVAKNVTKMIGRVLKGGGNIVWLVNPDLMHEIYTMTLGNNAIWTQANAGFKNAPNGLLLGRPIIETEACKTLGTNGDLILANLGGYRSITKSGGMQLARSMHLYFDQDVEAFKLKFRLDAQPRMEQAVTPPNSSVTRSHFVTLATRS